MRFFGNDAINRMYAHSVLQGFAEQMGGVFVFVYLLKAGLSVPMVMCTIVATVLSRFVIRQSTIPFARRFGLRNGLALGGTLIAVSYIFLVFIDGLNWALALHVIFAAIGEAYYWTFFRAIAALKSDQESRGAQVSLFEMINSLTGIVGPVIGGIVLTWLGPRAAFPIAACAHVLSIVPLLGLELPPWRGETSLSRENRAFAFRTYIAHGLLAAAGFFIWSVALFKTLGENFQVYGLAQGAAALLGVVCAPILGRYFDLGKHRWLVPISLAPLLIANLLRVAGYHSVSGVALAMGAGALAFPIFGSIFHAHVYSVAQKSGDPFRFHMIAEGGWDVGCAIGCAMAALLTYFGFGFALPLSIGFAGILIAAYQLEKIAKATA